MEGADIREELNEGAELGCSLMMKSFPTLTISQCDRDLIGVAAISIVHVNVGILPNRGLDHQSTFINKVAACDIIATSQGHCDGVVVGSINIGDIAVSIKVGFVCSDFCGSGCVVRKF